MLSKKILQLVAVLMIPVMGLFAQVTTSSLTGTVVSDNKPLVGATIKATHQPSGTVYTTVSRTNGQFTIPNMRVGGPYKVEITFVGFKTHTIEDIQLKLGEASVLNVAMGETASVIDEVQVTASGGRNSILNANRTGAVTYIGTRQIASMPTVTRSLNDLTRLTPQSSSTSTGAIAGGNYRQNHVTVDGSDFNNTFGIGGNLPANGSPISLDALSEISINIAPYDVRQSNFIGSAINAVTRSGTNQFSGSAYYFWRNQDQQGNKVAHNAALTRQFMEEKTIGFRFGGPIIKNKLFFFMNAEKGDRTQPGQLNVAATASAPFGSAPNITRPTNVFMDEVSSYLKTTYGYETGPYQGYDNESDNTRIVGRLDWNINNNHRMNMRYSQVESRAPSFASTSRSPLSGYASGQGRQGLNHLWFKNSNYYQEANFYSFAGEVNSTFGKFANTFRGTYTNQNDPRGSDSETFPFVDILDGSALSSVGNVLTSFGYEPFTFGNLRDVSTLSFVDYVTWNTGKHNWTAGLQMDFQSTKNGFQRFGTSYYTFRSWDDFKNGVKPVDYAITYSLTPGYEQAFPKINFNQYSFYGQDEMTLNKKLRLTVGLRADYLTWPEIPEIKTHPLVAALTFAGGEKINTGTLPDKRIMWSPRVGFNWDVKGNRSLQVRGGTGIFTGRVPTVWIVSQSGDAGLIQFTQVYQTPTADRNNPANYVTPGPFSANPRAYLPATPPTAGTAIPSTISAIDEDFKFPQAWKTSLAADFKLGKGFIASVEGVYNKDINTALGRNPNLVTPTALGVSGYPDNRPIYPISNTQKFINPLTSAGLASPTGTSAFNPVILDNAEENGYYWSLTGKIEKQFSNHWSAFAAYTRSVAKNVYDGTGDQLLNTWSLTQIVKNANDPERSYANYVVPDRFVASVSYRREYLKHLATSVSLFYEGSIQGRYSYTYTADFNRDGQTNDLIYVPRDATEINFADVTYGSGATAVTYTANQQRDLFFRFVEQDTYLRARKGRYAERNGAKMPWRNQVDVKFAQEIFHNIGGKKNTLTFTLDIFNFGNLLNKEWGIFQTPNAAGLLAPRNSTAPTGGTLPVNGVATTVGAYNAAGTQRPYFSLAQGLGNFPVTTSSFRQVNTLTSTYYMQFGLRYTFN
jgi:hypothetical protein